MREQWKYIGKKAAPGEAFTFLINKGDMTEATAFLPLSASNVDIIPTAGADILRPWSKKQEAISEKKSFKERELAERPIKSLTVKTQNQIQKY